MAHLPHLDLKQEGDNLRWFFLGEYGYCPKLLIFLSHALYSKKIMHKKKACLFLLMRRLDASISEAPIIDFSRVEALGKFVTALGVLGKTKEGGRTLSLSFLPTLLFVSALWQEKHGKDNRLPTCTFGMGAVYAHHSFEELAQSLLSFGG